MLRSRPLQAPRRASLALALLLLAAAGCANTKVQRTWSDPALEKGRYGRVMILVVAATHARRETAEDRLFKRLTADGVDAVRSYDSIPDDLFGDRDRLRAAVQASRADALLSVVVVGRTKDTEVVEGREQWTPVGKGLDYYGYVYTSYDLMRTPEVYQERTLTAETSLWDVPTAKVVWAAESLTRSGSETITTAEVTDDYAGVVLEKVRPYLRAR